MLAKVVLVLISIFAVPNSEARTAAINVSLSLIVNEDKHPLSQDMVRICAKDTAIAMDDLHKLHQRDFENPSEATQCFTHCIYEQMGLIQDGIFVEHDLVNFLDNELNLNAIKYRECHQIKGANKCETAFRIHKCREEHNLRELPPKIPAAAAAIPANQMV